MKKAAKQLAGIAAGAAATGAALAGAYYYYGSENAAKHRAQLREWVNKAEREIVREAKRLKSKALTDKNIHAIVSAVARQYQATHDLDATDVREFIAAMKERWQEARKVVRGRQRTITSRKRKS